MFGAETSPRRRLVVLFVVLTGLLAALAAPAAGLQPAPRPSDDRIVGGTVAAPGAWPTMAALYERGHGPDSQFCGGTVVDRSWVLTAGHCVEGARANQISVLVGTHRLDVGGTGINVVEIRRHPGYDDFTLRNDLALLRLDTPVPDSVPVQALASAGTDPASGTDVITVGWGDLGNGSLPWELRQVTLDHRSPSQCLADNGGATYYDTASMVCAWRAGKSACFGDSGGPLFVARSGGWAQIGIVSWGWECGQSTSVFTRVSAFSSWIRAQIRYGAQPDANAFVRRQYLDLFGRQPTNAELFYGAASLNSGKPLESFVRELMETSTYRTRTGGVVRLYQAVFLRRPDTGGMAYWVQQTNRGVSLKRIADIMVNASEFQILYGSLDDEDFVTLVYQNVLGRTPTGSEVAYWVDEVARGVRSRGQVMVGFSESPEYRSATDRRTKVIGAYFGLLRRVPSVAEIDHWDDRSLHELVATIIHGRPYAARF